MTFVTRSSDALTPPSILIACADPDLCFFFNHCLTAKGYKVETVPDGKTCFERIQQHAFSAVLLNHRLPNLDIPFLVTAIRTIQPTLPVIVTTVMGPSPVLLQRGAFDVLSLPCLRDELYDTLQRAISPTTTCDTDRKDTYTSTSISKTVLIIGLKPELQTSLVDLLRSNAYDPQSVETVEQALAILPDSNIRVGIGSLGSNTALLSTLSNKLLLIIFADDATLDEEQAASLLEQGAFAVIDQPYTHDMILAVLAQATCDQPFEPPFMAKVLTPNRDRKDR